MGRKSREEATLRALARKVWGDSYYERHTATTGTRASRRHRLTAIAGIGVGGPLLLSALGMVAFSTAASAHTSTINISCTQVEFVYQNFEAVLATSHESVTIDGVEVAQRDITFNGPSASDTIPISVPAGTHLVSASDHWFYNGQSQGQAYASQSLSYCSSGPTTTTTSMSSTSTSTTEASTTTTAPETTTTTAPETTTTESTTTTVPETTTTVAETTTTAPETSTTISSETTTTQAGPETSTTIGEDTTTTIESGSTTTIGGSSSTTTSTPVGPQGSTSTTTPVGPEGSTSPPSTAITPAPHGNLPFTGSGPFPLVAALAALGVGMLAVGLASLRRVVDHR